jgi:hypothetical protein
VCRVCWAEAQREAWAKNRTKGRAALKRAYAKHASKRRSESAKYKQQHREYYALAEWFRKKGIRVSHIAPSDITALVEMKQALKQAKAQTQLPTQSPKLTAPAQRVLTARAGHAVVASFVETQSVTAPPTHELIENMIELQDTDPMPFGKHKGDLMQDVPARYLHWLYSNGKKDDRRCPVADYIRRNLNALKQEYSDGIW